MNSSVRLLFAAVAAVMAPPLAAQDAAPPPASQAEPLPDLAAMSGKELVA
jgi:hypothetical protein